MVFDKIYVVNVDVGVKEEDDNIGWSRTRCKPDEVVDVADVKRG